MRTGLIKQCTGHDLIQSRDLYKTAITWRNKAVIIQCFNECPAIPDTGGGFLRRFVLNIFKKKYVENPKGPNELQIDFDLNEKFMRKNYGATFLKYLMDIYEEYGSDYDIPESVKAASKDFIVENDSLELFLNEFYIATGSSSDKILLKTIYNELKRPSNSYRDQIECFSHSQLAQKLRNRGTDVKIGGKNKTYVYGLKEIEEDRGEEVFA